MTIEEIVNQVIEEIVEKTIEKYGLYDIQGNAGDRNDSMYLDMWPSDLRIILKAAIYKVEEEVHKHIKEDDE